MARRENEPEAPIEATITATPTPASGGPPLERGQAFGRYLVLDRLGAGGMGVVYSAYDPDLDRKLAVKILRPEVSADQSRLLREARAMARLQHPNVIVVFDVGTFAGRVFVAMELVEGTTLSGWLAARRPTWRETLAMFAQAGRGLAAAHAVGLVHRDFKPGNVLVGTDGRVRVVDFGLARAVDAAAEPAVESSLQSSASPDEPITRTGALLGTPTYMSPEQFLGTTADARSDQFSFCVALYRALWGERPFAGDDALALAAEVTAGRLRQPPRDSAVPAWARDRVLRGLEREPERRWPSIDALLAALDRDPARRRRRWLIGGGATLATAALAAGALVVHRRESLVCRGAEEQLAGVWDDAVKLKTHAAFAATGKPYAEDAFRGVTRALDGYLAGWAAMRRASCEATRVRREQSEPLLDLRMECLGERLQDVRAQAELFTTADATVVEHAVQMASSLPSVSVCADVATLTEPVRPPADPATTARIEAIRRRVAQARALYQAGKFKEAIAVATPAADDARALRYRPLEAEALLLLGNAQFRFGATDAAHALQDSALAARAGRDSVGEAWAYSALLKDAETHAQFPAAHGWERNASAVLEALGGKAELPLAEFLLSDGGLLADEGKNDEALDEARRAIAIREKRYGKNSVPVAFAVENETRMLGQMGRFAEGELLLRRSLPILEKELGPDHPSTANTLFSLAYMLDGQGRDEEALGYVRRVVAIREKVLGPEHGLLSTTLNNMGSLLIQLHRNDEAAAVLHRALAIAEKGFGKDNPHTAVIIMNIGDLAREQKQYAEAEAWCQRAVPIFEHAYGPSHVFLASALTCIGTTQLDRHAPARALPWLERAVTMWDAHPGADSTSYAAYYGLAEALWDTSGDRTRAVALAKRARQGYAAIGAKGAKDVQDIDGWLASRSPPKPPSPSKPPAP